MISCLGGWCQCREHCENYLLRGPYPVERLCGPTPEPAYGRNGREVINLPDHSQAHSSPVAEVEATIGSLAQSATAHNVAGI